MDSTRLKMDITLVLVVVAIILTAALQSSGKVSVFQADGLIVDFEEYDTDWVEMQVWEYDSPVDALIQAAESKGYSITVSDEGEVTELNGYYSDAGRSWSFWTIASGSSSWTQVEDPSEKASSGSTVYAWAYRAEGEEPTVAVDQSGTSVYGYTQKSRSVTLSPSITEMMGAVRATSTIVGTDKYSNYPEEVVEMQNEGYIKIVGDYTNPSYETIVNLNPDVVFCDGSQYSHNQMRDRLTKVNICAILMYDGESDESILDNIFIMGLVMGYDLAAADTINDLQSAMAELTSRMSTHKSEGVMAALSGDSSPWVAGSYTYVSDLITDLYGNNVFSDMNGWTHVNSELVSKHNPSVIIILTTDYSATQSDYDYLISHLSKEWMGTDAYKNGRIYLLTESAGEMSQRPGPRYAQLAEMLAMIMEPDAFEKELPKYVGDNYTDYLTVTKNLGV